jgi:hypothetical protein
MITIGSKFSGSAVAAIDVIAHRIHLDANELAWELIIVLLIIDSHFLASNSKDMTELKQI